MLASSMCASLCSAAASAAWCLRLRYTLASGSSQGHTTGALLPLPPPTSLPSAPSLPAPSLSPPAASLSLSLLPELPDPSLALPLTPSLPAAPAPPSWPFPSLPSLPLPLPPPSLSLLLPCRARSLRPLPPSATSSAWRALYCCTRASKSSMRLRKASSAGRSGPLGSSRGSKRRSSSRICRSVTYCLKASASRNSFCSPVLLGHVHSFQVPFSLSLTSPSSSISSRVGSSPMAMRSKGSPSTSATAC
mmetsp:Transcript_13456/g.32939  ORF Transcript_13456/g.32939 Transcript_13456/m.32939 type:complete len:248 (-) Transcript_13456:347-1090(-)